MAKKRPREKSAPQPSAGFEIATAVAFNLGLGLFCAAEAWALLSAPSASVADYWLKLGLRIAGLGIAGTGWIAGSRLAPPEKMLMGLLLITGLGGLMWIEKLEFDADASILEPFRPEGGRLVHDGLGISVVPPAGWSIDFRPQILKAIAEPASRGKRLWIGESAMFLRMAHKRDSSRAGNLIVLYGGPTAYGGLSDAVQAVNARANECFAHPGVKNVTRPRLMQLDGTGVYGFGYQNADGSTCDEVIFRSGSQILTVGVEESDQGDRGQIDEFLKSIRITGRETDFSE